MQTLKIFTKPLPKPRMTRSDKWNDRPCVVNYRIYKDILNWGMKKDKIKLTNKIEIKFYFQMPKYWCQDRKDEKFMQGHHDQRPDIDNLIKGVLDALYEDDSKIYEIKATKLWNYENYIIINFY